MVGSNNFNQFAASLFGKVKNRHDYEQLEFFAKRLAGAEAEAAILLLKEYLFKRNDGRIPHALFGMIHDRALPDLLAAIAKAGPETRLHSALLVERISGESALPVVESLLEDATIPRVEVLRYMCLGPSCHSKALELLPLEKHLRNRYRIFDGLLAYYALRGYENKPPCRISTIGLRLASEFMSVRKQATEDLRMILTITDRRARDKALDLGVLTPEARRLIVALEKGLTVNLEDAASMADPNRRWVAENALGYLHKSNQNIPKLFVNLGYTRAIEPLQEGMKIGDNTFLAVCQEAISSLKRMKRGRKSDNPEMNSRPAGSIDTRMIKSGKTQVGDAPRPDFTSEINRYFSAKGFNLTGHGPQWITARRINDKAATCAEFTYRILPANQITFVHSIKARVYFWVLGDIYMKKFPNQPLQKPLAFHRYHLSLSQAKSLTVDQMVDFPTFPAVKAYKDGSAIVSALKNQFDIMEELFFSRYESMDIVKRILAAEYRDRWYETFGQPSVFLRLYFYNLEGKNAFLEYLPIAEKLVNSRKDKLRLEGEVHKADDLQKTYKILLDMLQD